MIFWSAKIILEGRSLDLNSGLKLFRKLFSDADSMPPIYLVKYIAIGSYIMFGNLCQTIEGEVIDS